MDAEKTFVSTTRRTNKAIIKARAGRFISVFHPYLAEFLGTALFIFLGDSSVALTIFHNDTIGGAAYLAISMGFGLGLMCALYVAGGSSGGHFNPAVTIASAVYREFPWRRVPGYIVAQTLGAFVGAALTYAQYRSAFSDYDGGTRQVQGPHGTAGIFATYPAGYLTNLNAAWNEGVATALLIIGIFGCTDKRGMLARSHVPIAVGLIFTTIALCIGHGTGFALNPARDFGPRVFTAIAGWGKDVFTASDYYFWIPLVVPIVGGVLGGLVYDTFIHFPVEPPPQVHETHAMHSAQLTEVEPITPPAADYEPIQVMSHE